MLLPSLWRPIKAKAGFKAVATVILMGCSSCDAAVPVAHSPAVISSQTLFAQAMQTIQRDPDLARQGAQTLTLPMPKLYNMLLEKTAVPLALVVDGFDLGDYHQRLLAHQRDILAAYGDDTLLSYLARRHLSFGSYLRGDSLHNALALASAPDAANTDLALDGSTCDKVAYSGDAISIGGAVATFLCMIPGVDIIACPVSAATLAATGAGLAVTDLSECHNAEGEATSPVAQRLSQDEIILQNNQSATLCEIDAGLASLLHPHDPCPAPSGNDNAPTVTPGARPRA